MRAEKSGNCFGPPLISSSVACEYMVKGKESEGQAVAAQGKLC